MNPIGILLWIAAHWWISAVIAAIALAAAFIGGRLARRPLADDCGVDP